MLKKQTLVTACSLLALSSAGAAVVGPVSGAVNGVQPATVMEVNPSGIGHINLVPYYSVRSGFDTYLNLTNTDTRNGKAVKVRFRSAVDGVDADNFTVLLGPGAQWLGAVTLDAAGGNARIVTSGERSCTLPANVNTALSATEGSVEIITLADIPRWTSGAQPSPLYAAVVATSAVGPSCNASALIPLATDSTSYADTRSKGLEVPTTGLTTQWTLINVARAASYTGRATAVEARESLDGLAGYGNVVLFPQTSVQINDRDRTHAYTARPEVGFPFYGRDGYIEKQMPDLSTPYLPSGLASKLGLGAAPKIQAYAISKALAANSIGGEFLVEPDILAKTDWILALPTLYLQVAMWRGFVVTGSSFVALSDWTHDSAGKSIGQSVKNFFYEEDNTFVYGFSLNARSINPYTNGTPDGSQTEATFRTREGIPIALQPPPPPDGFGDDYYDKFPYAKLIYIQNSSVLRFIRPGRSNDDGALGDVGFDLYGNIVNRWPIVTLSVSGWGRIQTPGLNGQGLPIIGFAVTELYNSAVAPGTAGVFGQTFPLTMTRP
jgi:hypothetical protein